MPTNTLITRPASFRTLAKRLEAASLRCAQGLSPNRADRRAWEMVERLGYMPGHAVACGGGDETPIGWRYVEGREV